VMALLLVELLQIAVISVVGVHLGWSPSPGAAGLLGAALAVLVGTAAFASLGLLVAGTLRAEATLAVANLIYLLLLAGGAVVLPATAYGGFGDVATWLPSGALGEAMRDALVHGDLAWRDLAVLGAWAVGGAALASRTFSWD
jgi:ABC-2 type transport system permease protein